MAAADMQVLATDNRVQYPHLLSGARVGRLTLRNRMIMGAMHTRFETLANPLEREVAFYGARVDGGIGMIISGGFSPNEEGLIEPDALTMGARTDRIYQRELTSSVTQRGVPFIAQLLHAGRYARASTCVGPGAERAPINKFTPTALTTKGVHDTIDAFAMAAEVARECGYSGLELMGSEGYLINQFLAPRTNQRDDAFGGTWERRKLFALSIVKSVRKAVGADFPLIFRLSALELVEGGMNQVEILDLAQELEQAGVDCLNTGIGWHESRIPTVAQVTPRAAFAPYAAAIKAVVSVPVIASNRINDPDVAEGLLADGQADLISLSRQMLADPDFPNRVAEGRPDLINTCIACNQACLDRVFINQAPTCLVNPRAGREIEFRVASPTRPKQLAVVGGGAAGMTFAAEAAALGHQVTLFEKDGETGGLIHLARAVPGKSEFDAFLRYMRARLVHFGVRVRTGIKPTVADLQGFDRVVLATGVLPRKPELQGLDHPSVVGYDDILRGRRVAGRRVAVMGAGGIGFDTVEHLIETMQRVPEMQEYKAEYGLVGLEDQRGGFDPTAVVVPPPAREITMLQRSPGRLGKTLSITTGWIKRRKLEMAGVRMLSGVSYERIDDDGLHIVTEEGAKCLAVDTVVLCTGQASNTDLADELKAADVQFELIGGAKKAGELDAMRAVEDATRLALAI